MRSDFEPKRIKEAAEVLARQLEAVIQHTIHPQTPLTGSKKPAEKRGWWSKVSKRFRSLFA